MKNTYQTQDIQELNELIDIAEKTSESARYYSDKISRTYLLLAFLFFLLFGTIGSILYFNFYQLTTQYQILLLILVGTFFCFTLSIFVLQYSRYKRQLAIEKDILFKLLEMIFDLFEFNIHKGNLSNVEKAIIEMRLKRVQFDFKSQITKLKNYS